MRVGYKAQITPGFKVWTQDQCYEMHLKSLEILERTGIIVHDENALNTYKDGGAYVNGKRVYIPAWMVNEALKTAPERIALNGRGKRIYLEENQVNYGLGTDLPDFQDWNTGEYRRCLLQDIIDTAVITDYLPNMDFVASMGIASDVTTRLADLYHFKAMVENTVKPLFMTVTDKDNLQAMIDMSAAIVGGYDELKRNPLFLLYREPVSPLVNAKEAHQTLMLASEYEIPVTYAAGITSGTTGPVTLAGNLALGNAECLGGLVLHQLVNPGAPFMYGIVPAPSDMMTTICCYGGPEIPLYFCIVGEMGRFYKLPSFGQSGNTDSAVIDQQAAIDAMFSIFAAALSGTNLVHDNGYICNGLVGSLEMLVLCDECASMAKHFMKGLQIGPLMSEIDMIDQAAPGGRFKNNNDTDTWSAKYLNRKNYEEWLAEGSPTTNMRIKDEVESILKNHKPEPLPSGSVEEIDRIIQENEKKVVKR